jgi:hypothetical protein
MAQDEKIFADGFSFKRQENAPDFVIGRVSIKVDDAITFMRKHEKGGWVNLNAKYGRSGNPYMELDIYEPKKPDADTTKEEAPKKKDAITRTNDDLPF